MRVDGEMPQEVRFGGPDQVNLAFFLGLNELFNRHAGNLDTLGGLAPQADTLGQEEILGNNANQRVFYMRRKTASFVGAILKSLGHYLYSDPFVELGLEKQIPGTQLSIPTTFSAENRVGEAKDFDISIEPYSMVYRSPQSQLRNFLELFQTVVLPMAPLLQAQGVGIDGGAIVRIISEYSDTPELNEVLTALPPPDPMAMGGMPGQGQPGQGQPEGPGKPPVTTRNYVRKNVSQGSRRGKENALAQALLGQMPQPDEAGALMR
jgi:hypothetical protein